MSFKKIFTGTFIALLASFVLMCLLTIVVYFSDIQDRTISTVVFVMSALSVFMGAYFMARTIACRGLINGLLLAVFYFLVLAVISFSVNGSISLSLSNTLRLLSGLAAGALGGVLGINVNPK